MTYSTARAGRSGVDTDMPKEPVRIMVVDDDPTNCKLLVDLLEYEGYETTVATGGGETIERLIDDREAVDVVLLDLMMPDVSGLEVLEELAESRTLNHVSVAVLSAVTDRLSLQSALDLGALDYITKPFDRHELIARVRGLVSMRLLLKEIQAREARLESLIANTSTVLYTFSDDVSGTTAHVSENVELVLGYEPSTFFRPGFSLKGLIHADDMAAFDTYIDESRGLPGDSGDFRYTHGDGTIRKLRVNAQLFRRLDGPGNEFIVALSDTTGQRPVARRPKAPPKPEFITLHVRTDSLVTMKDEYRTLLGKVAEFTEQLTDVELSDEQRATAQTILEKSRQILGHTMKAAVPSEVATSQTAPSQPSEVGSTDSSDE